MLHPANNRPGQLAACLSSCSSSRWCLHNLCLVLSMKVSMAVDAAYVVASFAWRPVPAHSKVDAINRRAPKAILLVGQIWGMLGFGQCCLAKGHSVGILVVEICHCYMTHHMAIRLLCRIDPQAVCCAAFWCLQTRMRTCLKTRVMTTSRLTTSQQHPQLQGGRLRHWQLVRPLQTALNGSNSGNSSRCRRSSCRHPALRREGVLQASSHEGDAPFC